MTKTTYKMTKTVRQVEIEVTGDEPAAVSEAMQDAVKKVKEAIPNKGIHSEGY